MCSQSARGPNNYSQQQTLSRGEKLQKFAADKWEYGSSTFENLESQIRRGHSIPSSWDLFILRDFYESMRESEKKKLDELLPKIVNLAKKLKDEHKYVLPLLTDGTLPEIYLTREEIACVLANCFLCKFPNPIGNHDPDFVQLNFIGLYSSIAKNHSVAKEKIKCLLNYFETVFGNDFQLKMKNPVKFIRKKGQFFDRQDLKKSKQDYTIIVNSSPLSEEAQVSFSNKKIGGGVLGNGSLQEEIKFITCPELIVARIFCKEMADDEAVIVSNALQYSDYDGYAESFTHKKLTTPRQIGAIICIDAIDFSSRTDFDQYSEQYVKREIVKAIAGFSAVNESTIASGYWGCGAFKGDQVLKTFIQLIAAWVCRKKLNIYTSTSDEKVNDRVLKQVGKSLTLSDVYDEMLVYCLQKSTEHYGFAPISGQASNGGRPAAGKPSTSYRF